MDHEKNLKKVLGLTDVFGLAFGQIISAGVLVLTGLAIGMTGKGVDFERDRVRFKNIKERDN